MTKPSNNPIGRPPAGPSGTAREQLNVRLDAEERAAIDAVGDELGTATTAETVRALPRIWRALTDRQRKGLVGR